VIAFAWYRESKEKDGKVSAEEVQEMKKKRAIELAENRRKEVSTEL